MIINVPLIHIARVACSVGWDASPSRAVQETFIERFGITRSAARIMYDELIKSKLVKQEFRSKGMQDCGQYRFVMDKEVL